MSENHTDSSQSSHEQNGSSDREPEKKKTRPQKQPSPDPENLSEQLVAETLRGRKSKCSHGCSSDGKGCSTGGCGVGSLVELIANNFEYTDERHIVEVTYAGYRRGFAEVKEDADPLKVRDVVVVRSQNGQDWASVSMTGSLVHAKRKAKRLSREELPMLMRKADENDLKRIEQCKVSERQAYSVCKTRIEAFDLPMILVGAEWQFDHKKLTFYFTADGRVDFRELVRDLAAIFNTRIELRQIPMRDAAKRLGGMGVCGLELCCTTHLGRYEHVTLDHAKIQQIPANPSKLSGQCGRLKCCLLYEVDTYVEGLKRFPPIEGTIRTEQGKGIIHKIDLFKDLIYLHYPETSGWETITLEDYRDIAAGRKTKKQREAEEEQKRLEEERASLRGNPADKTEKGGKVTEKNPQAGDAGESREKGGRPSQNRKRSGRRKSSGQQGKPQSSENSKPQNAERPKAKGPEGQTSGNTADDRARAEQKSGGRPGGRPQRRKKGRGEQKPTGGDRPGDQQNKGT